MRGPPPTGIALVTVRRGPVSVDRTRGASDLAATSSYVTAFTGRTFPSSFTSKSSAVRPGTGRPWPSSTVTSMTTSAVVLRKVGVWGDAGVCGKFDDDAFG